MVYKKSGLPYLPILSLKVVTKNEYNFIPLSLGTYSKKHLKVLFILYLIKKILQLISSKKIWK